MKRFRVMPVVELMKPLARKGLYVTLASLVALVAVLAVVRTDAAVPWSAVVAAGVFCPTPTISTSPSVSPIAGRLRNPDPDSDCREAAASHAREHTLRSTLRTFVSDSLGMGALPGAARSARHGSVGAALDKKTAANPGRNGQGS